MVKDTRKFLYSMWQLREKKPAFKNFVDGESDLQVFIKFIPNL
jgi:hypothetical protein